MKITPILEFYNRIMCAEDEAAIVELNTEIQSAVLHGKLSDNTEIMILNMALQIKSNFFLMKELMMFGGATIIMGGGDFEDLDPEEMQLEEFHNEEFEDFQDGNILMMKDFKKE